MKTITVNFTDAVPSVIRTTDALVEAHLDQGWFHIYELGLLSGVAIRQYWYRQDRVESIIIDEQPIR